MAMQYMELFEMRPNMTHLESSMENLTAEEFVKFIESFNVSDIMKLDTGKYLQEPDAIVMMVLCVLALGTNIISILATSHVPSNLFTAHFRLILSLAASDIMIVVSILFHIVNKVMNPPRIFHLHSQEERLVSSCGFQLVVSINVTAHLISLLNLFAMAQDHYVAIIKPLHYHHIMRPSRVNIMIIILWVISFLGGFSNFYAGIGKPPHFKDFNICERALYSSYQAEYLLILLTILCFLGITVIYTALYCKIKHHNSLRVTMSKNRMHNRKALVTTLMIIGTFAACWLPGMIFQLALIIQIHIDESKIRDYIVKFVEANNYLYILLLCNSLCDPIIYTIRLPEVQLGYLRFLSKYFVTFRKILHRRRMSQTWSARTSVNTYTDTGCALNLLERNKENGNTASSDSKKTVDSNTESIH